jgi:menaquinone-dependent protoporphyrinogen oxidase
MNVLVAYASKHGATREIAERIASTLQAAGCDAEARPVQEVINLTGYDAVVIGSAVYFGSWMKAAAACVRRHRAALAARPVWLFSSGPLGTATTDDQGRDLRETAEPKEIAEFRQAIAPRDHRVFFGALDRRTFGFTERVIQALPAGRALLVEGDVRDWADIERWAAGIARTLAPQPLGHGDDASEANAMAWERGAAPVSR